MSAYYNENDPKAAAWLRELIKAGHIANGDIDERSIVDVRSDDLIGYTQCHFFAGIGGWPYALRLVGWPDDEPVWTGSCPCQPFSAAGAQKGEEDERHLWPEFRRLIADCAPNRIFGEQVANSIGFGWIDGVRADLEAEKYALGIAVLGAHSVGAPHIRQRLYWVADSAGERRTGQRLLLREEETGWDSGQVLEITGGSAVDGLADTQHSERWAEYQEDRDAPRRNGSGWSSTVSRLGDSNLSRSQGCGERPDEYADQWAVGQAGEFGWMADPRCERGTGRREPRELAGKTSSLEGAKEERKRMRDDAVNHGGATGFWSDFSIIHCLDGKARRIEPGTFPLAHGIPKGMVRGGDKSAPINSQNSAEGRMMRLRGYGNAIVPQVAAEFIAAYLDIAA